MQSDKPGKLIFWSVVLKNKTLMEKVEEINVIFERLEEKSEEIQKNALDMLLQFVKGTSTLAASSTLNLSYLENNKLRLEKICDGLNAYNKRYLCDILSVINVLKDDSLSLHYRVSGNVLPLETWGHQYVKKILGCMLKLTTISPDIKPVADDCISFLFRHNMELDAIDFMEELGWENTIVNFVDEHNYNRICLYLSDLEKYAFKYANIILEIHRKMKNYSEMLISLLNISSLAIPEFLASVEDGSIKTQLAFMLARANYVLPQKEEFMQNIFGDATLYTISCNKHLGRFFSHLCTDLQILKPKNVPDFLRGSTFLRHDKEISVKCLAPICIANGLVHLGFERDTVFSPRPEDPRIEIDFDVLGKAAKSEIISVFSSIGAIYLYSQQQAFEVLNEYLFSENPFKKTSALLGLAISNVKVFDENYTAMALLLENLKVNCSYQRIATIFSLQLIYSGTCNYKLKDVLKELVYSENVETSCFASFTLGSIFFGSADAEIASMLIQNLVDKSTTDSENGFFGLLILGFALLFYKNGDYQDALNTLKEVNTPYYIHVSTLTKCLAHFGSGDVELMNEILGEAFEGDEGIQIEKGDLNFENPQEVKDERVEQEDVSSRKGKAKISRSEGSRNLLKSVSLLGVALLSMGDELFSKMALRVISSSSLLDNSHLKSTISLCFALLSPSSPSVELVDTLSKFCNSSETKTILSSIISLGIVGAGTNNTRVSDVLEQQYAYNTKCLKAAPASKISQGLLHMGKGTMTLSPFAFNKKKLLEKNFVGLLASVFMLMDPESSPMLSKYMYLNYFFIQASSLKQVVTLDEEMNYTKTQLRIGEPVNNVGVVGRPRKISSVQTHNSPIILQENEMAEICEDDDVYALTSYIEDVVIVRNKG